MVWLEHLVLWIHLFYCMGIWVFWCYRERDSMLPWISTLNLWHILNWGGYLWISKFPREWLSTGLILQQKVTRKNSIRLIQYINGRSWRTCDCLHLAKLYRAVSRTSIFSYERIDITVERVQNVIFYQKCGSDILAGSKGKRYQFISIPSLIKIYCVQQ